jgi:HEAT repeat protein
VNTHPDRTLAQSLSDAVLLALKSLDPAQRERAIDRAAETVDPEGLVGLISTEDALRRNAALEALARAGRRSVPALVRALDDQDPEVVMFAASTLGKTLDPSAIPHLARALRHPDINVCQAAIESLGALRAVSALGALDELLAGDPWLRFSVVHTLGEIGDHSSVHTLVGLLDDDQLREGAIGALGKIGGYEIVGVLVERLQATSSARDFGLYLEALGAALVQIPDLAELQAHPFWTAFAERAESTVGPRLVEALRAPRPAASAELAREEGAIELVRCLRLRLCFPEMVAAAADERLAESLLFAAADIGIGLVPFLTPALAHKNPNVRRFAARAMVAVSFEQGAGPLTALLKDPDEAIRILAIKLIARLHHGDGLDALARCLTDASSSVRATAAEALSRMDARLVTMAMLNAAAALNGEPELPLSIMQANPHPLQRGFIETCLGHPDQHIRRAAVTALAAQRVSDLVDVFEPMLDDQSGDVRRTVIAALAERPSERTRRLLLALLDRDTETRADVIRALGRIGDDRLIPRLMAVFRSCSPLEQVQAIDALGAIDSPSVEPFIARQLGHKDPRVRRHAVAALVRIGTASALRRLAIAIRDANPRVRAAVSRALASCPHPLARNALERLSVDPEDSVASAARATLGR